MSTTVTHSMYKTYEKAQRKKHPRVVRHTRRPKCKHAGCNKHAVSASDYCRRHLPRRVWTLNDIKSSKEDSKEDSEEDSEEDSAAVSAAEAAQKEGQGKSQRRSTTQGGRVRSKRKPLLTF